MIKLLSIESLIAALMTLEQVKSALKAQGIDQWDTQYPTKETLEQDILNQEAFGWFEEDLLIGYMVLNTKFDEEYLEVPWQFLTPSLIIHRLFILPAAQGKGLSKKMIRFAEALAKSKGYNSIRLDTFSLNKTANAAYIQQGYQYAGTVRFRKGIFNCYEKEIK